MSRKTTFQDAWLDPSQNAYNQWLKKGTDKWTAFCGLCKKSFDIGNMGLCAVRSHEKGKKHKERATATINCNSLLAWREPVSSTTASNISTPSSPISTREVDTVQTKSLVSQVSQVPKESEISRFLVKDDITCAEILWALNVVSCHISSRSGEKCADIFPLMFSDSAIANRFQMKKDKLAYTITYGLGPYFQSQLADVLKKCNYFVVSFDESLNKVVQEGQMDIVIRFWDSVKSEVATRYLTSAFLGRATAKHLFDAFSKALGEHELSLKKMLQISMDGPSVNLKMLSDIKGFLIDDADPDEAFLIDIGTCSLHIVHGAFKTAHNKCGWSVHKFLRSLFYLFKDFPSRRAQYKDITNSSLFPRKFCAIRWIENAAVAERAITILPLVKAYIAGVSKSPPASDNYKKVKEFLGDRLLEAKLGFFQSIAVELEVYLTRYQSNDPLLPFLYSDMYALLRSLMSRFLKKTVMESVTNPSKLCKVDVSMKENHASLDNVDVGFPALKGMKGLTKLEVMTLRKECQTFLEALCVKLLEKSPLKFKLVRGATCLDPEIILNPTLSDQRLKAALEVFVECKRISPSTADCVKREYMQLCQSHAVKEKLRHFDRKKHRIDNFLMDTIFDAATGSNLVNFCKQLLVLSHGNAAVERGFSINKECLVENLKAHSLIAQRVIHDAVSTAGGIQNVTVNKRMILSVRNAASKRRDALRIQEDTVKKEENKRKRAVEELKDLKAKKKRLLEQKDEEVETFNTKIKNLEKIVNNQ